MNGIMLIELLMTLIITAIVMGSIYNVLQHSLQAQDHVETQAEVIQNGRMAIERLSKELRQIGSFLNLADVDTIRFGIDFNGDGDYTDDGERIQYRLNGTELQRRDWRGGSWQPYEVIADYVTNFTLSYRDNNNILLSTPVGAPADIRLISMDLNLEKRRMGAKGKEVYTCSLRATSHPRNR